MFSFDTENITKGIGIITATFAMIGGGYTLLDKVGNKDILTWAPEYFEISDGPSDSEFEVIIAREKHRDDCSVERFELEVKDSEHRIHIGVPSVAKFSGPASDAIDKFGYSFTISAEKYEIAIGAATLLAHIEYKCPEGDVLVNYPDHPNMKFEITR